MYRTRRYKFLCAGRKGGSDAYGMLQIPYKMLGKFVFPMMKYEGWAGLTTAQAKAKNQEMCHELREHSKALKVQEQDASVVRQR